MDCGSSGWGFESPYLPLIEIFRISYLKFAPFKLNVGMGGSESDFMGGFQRYLSQTALIWQEGLMVDFLQKKVVDRWLRTFVSASANLFSDKVIFELIYRFYITLFLDKILRFNVSEHDNISSLLHTFLLFLSLMLILLFTWHVFIGWVSYRCF